QVAEGNSDIAVEYETPGPVAVEENLGNGKKVVISAEDEYNYTDILAYSELDNRVKIGDKEKIKLYWDNNESGEVIREEVGFDAYDLDEDGFVDYVEWVVPHLSSQTYTLIYISKADLLDSSRNYLEDVYDNVKSRDNVWQNVSDGQYIRVTFEKNLTLGNDMTIYARAACNGTIRINNVDVPCEVYYKKLELDALRRGNE
ncbi:MAG: hypothetical protein KKE50_00165, partial [Nanoarchaeota archaeon]|nr:hypothetical protein [Nanoarchaeota archaeon]